jgi:hypothetical protein
VHIPCVEFPTTCTQRCIRSVEYGWAAWAGGFCSLQGQAFMTQSRRQAGGVYLLWFEAPDEDGVMLAPRAASLRIALLTRACSQDMYGHVAGHGVMTRRGLRLLAAPFDAPDGCPTCSVAWPAELVSWWWRGHRGPRRRGAPTTTVSWHGLPQVL